MDAAKTTQALPAGPRRILIACSRCKARKIRCDGGKPKCGHCVTRSTECIYAVVRNYRGPAKSKSAIEGREHSLTGESLGIDHNSSQYNPIIPQPSDSRSSSVEAINPHPREIACVDSSDAPQYTSSVSSFQSRSTLASRATIFPDFLHSGPFEENMKRVKTNIDDAKIHGNFTALIPYNISNRLIHHSFDEIMAEYQLLAMPSFLALLDAQYAASAAGPAGQPARWGLVNAVLATALRSKIAPGAEAELSVVANAFYRNAISVIQELILQQPSLLSIQALLAMAIFAKDIPDTQAYYMLSTNASRQVESFDISSSTTDPVDFQRYKQVYQIAYMFSADATQRLKNRPMGNNEGGSGGHGV